MPDFKPITSPISEEDAKALRAGDYLLLSGELFTARDAAHKRMYEAKTSGTALPVNTEGASIFYVGPCFDKDGRPTGAGPTTSGRCAIGGAGALYAKAILSLETVAYPELGTEAVRKMRVKDMPVIVGIDSLGNSIFASHES